MKVRRGPVVAMLGAVLSLALILAAVRGGLRLPGLEVLSGLGRAAMLDYSRFSSLVAPLSPRFVDKALGASPAASTDEAAPGGPVPGADGVPFTDRVDVRHALTNDDFERAYRVSAIPFTARTDGSRASRQSVEPEGCAPLGGGTIWYRYRADRDLGLIANTIGTTRATSLAVYTGNGIGGLTPVPGACHTGVRGSAYVTFAATRDATYFFQITNAAGGGPLVFNLDPHGTTEMVSDADQSAGWHAISGDGRFVAFSSPSATLVPGDRNDLPDVFVRNLGTGAIERVSVGSRGREGNGPSKPWTTALSEDGRYVAFTSLAANLVDGDRNDAEDVFVRDRLTGVTIRVSMSSGGGEGRRPVAGAGDPSETAVQTATARSGDYNKAASVALSADGRFVVFDSSLTGLVREDRAGAESEIGDAGRDVFLHDRRTGRTVLASASAAGANGNAMSWLADVSADGRYVTFTSSASNLLGPAAAASNAWTQVLTDSQIYVRDMHTGAVEMVSVTPNGAPGSGKSYGSVVSGDGRFVAFYSFAPDLVGGDRNGELLDVFVRDRLLGRTEIVSRTSAGEQAVSGQTWERAYANNVPPAISWDGRYVAFHSDAAFVPGDTDESENVAGRVPLCDVQNEDVFLRDRSTGTTTRVSDASDGKKGNGASAAPVMSADGRRIAFVSLARNLARERPSSDGSPSCVETANVFVHTFPVLR